MPHNAFPLDADHREIVKFSNAEGPGFNAIMSAVKKTLHAALRSGRPGVVHGNSDRVTSRPQDTEREPLPAHLMRFDMIILVDDSASMLGPWRAQAHEVLAAVVELAVGYDKDGVGIRFFTNMDHAGDKMTSSRNVMELFDRVRADGVTRQKMQRRRNWRITW